MKAYSVDLRERIVRAVGDGGCTEEVADRFEVHPRTVRRYLTLRRKQGNLAPKPRRGRLPKLTPEQQEAFREQLKAYPTLTYPERAELFYQERGVRLSIPTVCRWVKRLRYSRKK